ncbi:EpsG family protein [Aeromonas veronii]|uniref:EpsG family protein n=1 Tax=Aeromonas veronii TaxID=654 RepID=UPI003D2050CE
MVNKNLVQVKVSAIVSLLLSMVMMAPYYTLMDYPFPLNPDIQNYSSNYINENWSYEPGYEFFSYILREYGCLNFTSFWATLLIVQAIILSLIYARNYIFLIAFSNVFVMSEFFYGTQVRYSLGCLIFVLAVVFYSEHKSKKKFFLALLATSFHYGLAFVWMADYLKKFVAKFILSKQPFSFIILIMICLLFSKILVGFIEILLPYTRFSYYSGSEYLVSKSLSSTLYIIVFSLLTYAAVRIEPYLVKNTVITLFISILMFSLLASDVAVLSGRLLLFSFIIEPFVIYIVISKRKTAFIGVMMLVASLSKMLNYLSLSTIF